MQSLKPAEILPILTPGPQNGRTVRVTARRTHGGFVALALTLVVLCTIGDDWRYAAVTAANAVPLVVLVVQLRRGTCTDRLGWAVMIAGTAVLAVHNGHNQIALATTGSPADGALAASTLALGYVLLLAGGLRATLPYARRDGGGMLDATLVGLAVASGVWGLVLHPALVERGSTAGTIAYELLLVLLVTGLTGAVVRAAVVARNARGPALYLLLAMTATNVADVASTLTLDPITQVTAPWVGAVCVVALLAFAAALAHPSLPALADPERRPRGLTRSRLTFLGAALSVNPALTGLQALVGRPVDVVLLSLGSLLMVPLVVTRIGLLAQSHAEAVRRLHDLASLDELTGLPNRRALVGHLEALLARVADGVSPGAVLLYLDLDDFKSVNDEHGHGAGDHLLRELAGRLLACVRSSDLVARCGGDEFVVVLEGPVESTVAAVVPAMELALSHPVDLGPAVVSVRTSIGVAPVRRGELARAEELIDRADAEMYLAKRASSGSPLPPSSRPTGTLVPNPR